jgi:hypothetical protein
MSAWTMVAGRGCCTKRVADWRNSPSSATSSLLQPSPPLLSNVSLDARLVTGGRHMTEGEGRRGLRGGSTAHSPTSTPNPLLKKNPLRPSRLLPDNPSLQSLPHHRQQFCSCCLSWPATTAAPPFAAAGTAATTALPVATAGLGPAGAIIAAGTATA